MVLRREAALVCHPGDHDENAHTYDHVNGVHARQGKVQRIKDLCPLLDFGFSLVQLYWVVFHLIYAEQLFIALDFVDQVAFAANHVVIEGWNVVFLIFFAPLLRLNSQEGQSEDQREQQHFDLELAIAELGGTNRHGHGQATADQDRGVKGANPEVQAAAGGGKFRKEPTPVNQISTKHAAEEHDFCAQEPPHAKRGRVALLLFVGKVVSQLRAVFVFNLFDEQRTIAQASPLPEAASFCIRRLPRSLPVCHRS